MQRFRACNGEGAATACLSYVAHFVAKKSNAAARAIDEFDFFRVHRSHHEQHGLLKFKVRVWLPLPEDLECFANLFAAFERVVRFCCADDSTDTHKQCGLTTG